MTEDAKTQFRRLLAENPNEFRIFSPGDDINAENMESHGPFENSDSQSIELIRNALATGQQIAVVAAGATSLLLMIAKPGTRLFDGPPGTKQSPYVALTTEGYSSLLEGTQAKLNGRHEQGKSLYKKALAAFRQAEEMRPNEASPKLGIAEASAHLWASVDANSVLKTIHAAEQLLLNGLSEGKINKFNGKDSVQYLYALCHLELKNRDLAKEHLRQALVINPEHRYAAGILKSVEEADSKKGACFVATAAYGTPLAPEVQTLRNFREEVIRKSSIGRSFIWSYGIVSPPLAKLISKSDILKKVARNLLIGPILRQIKARDK